MADSTANALEVSGAASLQKAPDAKHSTATLHQPKHPPVQAPSAAGAVGTSVLALALVIGLIIVLGKVAKRIPGMGAAAGNNALRLVATLPLGPKDRAVVVDVNGTQLLIGVGAGGPRVLHQLESPLPMPVATSTTSFSDILSKLKNKQ